MNKEVNCKTCLIENEDGSMSSKPMEYKGDLGIIESTFKDFKIKGQKGIYQCDNCKEVIVA